MINVLLAVTQARIRARKPSSWSGERNAELESAELEGNVSPESAWLNRFQNETPQDGTRRVLWIWVGGGWTFYLQGIWVELQQEAWRGGGGGRGGRG